MQLSSLVGPCLLERLTELGRVYKQCKVPVIEKRTRHSHSVAIVNYAYTMYTCIVLMCMYMSAITNTLFHLSIFTASTITYDYIPQRKFVSCTMNRVYKEEHSTVPW